MKSAAAGVAALFACGFAAAQAQDCSAPRMREAQAEKARVQEHMERIQALRATLTESPAHRAAAERADQALAKDRDAIAKIEARTRIYEGIPALTRQIEETKRQLSSLGFDERSADFERLGEMSAAEQAHLKKQLLAQLRKVTLDKGADYMQARFLERIKTMTPQKLTSIAEQLKKAGADDPVFQEWLRSFRPNASREVLVNGAEQTIKFFKKEENLYKMVDGLDAGTVEGNQEAFLELVSYVSDYPALGELKAVAAGVYHTAEAGVFLYVLSGNQHHLDRVTTDQLSRQRALVKRMETLIRQRNAACAGTVPGSSRPSA
jgi:hypothetical protein